MHLKYELYHTLQKIWDLSMQDEIVLKNKTLIFAIILEKIQPEIVFTIILILNNLRVLPLHIHSKF